VEKKVERRGAEYAEGAKGGRRERGGRNIANIPRIMQELSMYVSGTVRIGCGKMKQKEAALAGQARCR